jgi:galactokinase
MHSFSDARFIPDIMTNITINNEEDSTALVIQNRSGTVKIAVDENAIRVKNNNVSININNDSVTGVAPGGFNLNGCTIDQNGAISSPVSITAPTVAAGSSLTKNNVQVADQNHTHNSGLLIDSMSGPVSGTTASSNG